MGRGLTGRRNRQAGYECPSVFVILKKKTGSDHGDVYCTDDIECAAGDVMTMYIKGYRNFGSYYGTAGNLVACIEWDNGF